MPRIDRDPTGDIAPPRSVIEAALPASLHADDWDPAIQRALDAWQAHHDTLVAEWNAQVEADAAAAREQAQAEDAERLRLEEVRLAAIRDAEEAERLALEAKRPKFNVDPAAEPPSVTELQAPLSTREDLRKGKWVAWHLLTPEMCREDMDSFQTEPEYKLTPAEDGTVVVRAARRATKTPVLADRQLTYEQWSSGIPIYLRTVKDVGWAPDIVEQWNGLLFQLQHHNARFVDSRAVVYYAAGLRADWHRDFQDSKPLFNVSRISETRMNNALFEVKLLNMDAATQVIVSLNIFPDLALIIV